MQAAFNKATTSVKRPLAESDTYRTGTIFDYTRPEFPSMIKPEEIKNLWKTKINVSSSNTRPSYTWWNDKININPNLPPLKAEHESIHAMSVGGGNFFQRMGQNVNQLFWKDLTPKQQGDIKKTYGVSGPTEEFRWLAGKGQEAPAVLWEVVKGNPRAASLYTAAVPFFQKYFRPEFFE